MIAPEPPIPDFADGSLTEWMEANWSGDLTLREWWRRLVAARLAFPGWPVRWGGADAGRDQLRRRNAVFGRFGAVGPPTGLGVLMGAPVVLEFGTDEQRSRFLPPLADGTEGWCQLFSEPDAGSDLASVSTSAVRDGDEWIVNGQKIWTSGATHSARGMLLARTDPDQPKHRGMGYFIIEMDQPGVEVRPIHQMNGESHFNEVFFDDARVADADRIGPPDRGWPVALATLAHERAGLGDAAVVSGIRPPAGEAAGCLDRLVSDLVAAYSAQPSEQVADIAAAAMLGRLAERWDVLDPVARHELAQLVARERIGEWLQARTAQAAAAGGDPGRTGVLLKLDWTERLKVARDLSARIGGARTAAPDTATPDAGVDAVAIDRFITSVPSASIAGGSDEVQRNVIAERVLGLPKDIAVDRDVPFRDRMRGPRR
jgi:alkylation response protein AidB-like acyl-CoA dehydrogenase